MQPPTKELPIAASERPDPVEGGAPGSGSKPADEGWIPPVVTPLGSLAELLKGGGGKTSVAVDGDGRKGPGSG